MSSFIDLRADVAAMLTDAGVGNVTTDPRVEPPGVLVDAPSLIDPGNGGATWLVTLPVRIIAPPPGDAAALDWLLATLDTVMVALGAEETRARAGTYPLNDKDHPAYSVDLTRTLVVPC